MDSNCLTDQSSSAPNAFLASGGADVVSGNDVLPQPEGPPPQIKDGESYLFEPPPLDWRSESSSDTASPDDLYDPGSLVSVTPSRKGLVKASPSDPALLSLDAGEALASVDVKVVGNIAEPIEGVMGLEVVDEAAEGEARGEVLNSDMECPEGSSGIKSSTGEEEVEGIDRKSDDDDHNRIHSLLNQLQLMEEEPHPPHHGQYQCSSSSQIDSSDPSLIVDDSTETTGLLFSDSHHRDMLGMLQFTDIGMAPRTCVSQRGEVDAVVSVSYSEEDAQRFWQHYGNGQQKQHRDESSVSDYEDMDSAWKKRHAEHPEEDESAAEREQVS